MTTTATETNTCLTCELDAKREAGLELTNQERNHWMLWGCTCNNSDEAVEWMESVTR